MKEFKSDISALRNQRVDGSYRRKIGITPLIAFLVLFLSVAIGYRSFTLGLSSAEAIEPSIASSTFKTGSAPLLSAALSRQPMLSLPAQPRRAQLSFPSGLDLVRLSMTHSKRILVNEVPSTTSRYHGKLAATDPQGNLVQYTVDSNLQAYIEGLIKQVTSPHVAIVAMDPTSGKILGLASKSKSVDNLLLHSHIPAASIFKLVTTAAALENETITPYQQIKYRGGMYTLNQWNYKPDRKDNKSMSVSEALGKSVNPVFSRVALKYLDQKSLANSAEAFGFNAPLNFDQRLTTSSASVPSNEFQLGRTAAGFGEIYFSPIHAAALMSGIANGGYLPRPYMIDQVLSPYGEIVHRAKPEALRTIMRKDTARTLLNMMESTTKTGTSRKEFAKRSGALRRIRVAAKTGTLSGTDPKGINHWFVAAAPLEKPTIAIAVLVIDPSKPRTSASRLGRLVFEKFFS